MWLEKRSLTATQLQLPECAPGLPPQPGEESKEGTQKEVQTGDPVQI